MQFLELIKSLKSCVYKAFIFFILSSIVIEVARKKIAISLKHVLTKQKQKTKLLFIETNTNLIHI